MLHDDANPAPASKPLRRAALGSALFIGLGFGYSQIIRFISSVVLARLLFPEAFGLMAMVYTVLMGLQLFSDLGIRSSVIHNTRGDDRNYLNTAWTLQILRGGVLWLAAIGLAWPAAYWRPEPAPDLLWLLPLLGFTAVLDGFTSTKLFTLSRHIAQGREVLIEVIAATVGVGLTIVWALLQPSVLALASGPLLSATLKMLLSHLILPGLPNRICWDRAALRELVHFAKWIYIGTLFTFVAQYADRLVVGIQSISQLGVYHFARQLADIPAELMGVLAGKLIFPVYSRLLREQADLSAVFGRVHRNATALAALLLTGVLATGATLIHCLYDTRYQDAAWILPLLAVGAWFRMLESNAGALFFARGEVRYSAISNASKAIALLALLPIGHAIDGLRGLVIGFAIGDVIRYGVTVGFLGRQGFHVLRFDLPWSFFVLITATTAWYLGNWCWSIDPSQPRRALQWLPRLLIQGTTVVVVWGMIMLWLRRGQRPPAQSSASIVEGIPSVTAP